MTKAYDKVQYKILLNKLYGIGIRGTAHDWFTSNLNNRKQFVEIENTDPRTCKISMIRSDIIQTNNSIPQGSVLGCILFLIYINDLPKIISDSCILFADDISILTSCKTDINLNNKFVDILNPIHSWMTDHNLDINYNKTKLMQFRPHQKKPLNLNFTNNNIKIDNVDNFTLLGINIDTHLNWKSHVQKIVNKLSSFTYALRELKKATDLKTAMTSYYAYAFSWINYGILLWGNSTDAQDVFICQKKCVRILANIKEPKNSEAESCKPHFCELKVLTLVSIYILEACKFVRKYPDLFLKKADQPRLYEYKHKHRLELPTSKLAMHSSGPNTMASKIYNRIPDDLKNETDILFIKIIKNVLIKKVYYSLDEFFNDKTFV